MNIEIDDNRLGGARVEETIWGYKLHGVGASFGVRAAKAASLGAGAAAILTCMGLWVLPGTAFGGDLVPLKLAVSTFLFLVGSFLVQIAQVGGRAEVHVDHSRRELRAIERNEGDDGKLLATWSFDEIGAIDVFDGHFLIADREGELLADLRLGRRTRARRTAAMGAQTA